MNNKIVFMIRYQIVYMVYKVLQRCHERVSFKFWSEYVYRYVHRFSAFSLAVSRKLSQFISQYILHCYCNKMVVDTKLMLSNTKAQHYINTSYKCIFRCSRKQIATLGNCFKFKIEKPPTYFFTYHHTALCTSFAE